MNIKEKIEKIYLSLELNKSPFSLPDDDRKIIRELKEKGLIRRYGAVIDLRKAGFFFNAMVCWKISKDKINDLREALSSFPRISHCYFRRTYPQWPYAFYTMIHARSKEEFKEIMADLIPALGNPEYKVLKTIKEYKKKRQKIDFSLIRQGQTSEERG